MKYGSLFSGIGGLDCGLARAGHKVQFLCESDPWRREILAARFPGVPIYDDVHGVTSDAGPDHTDGRDSSPGVELLCGGFPCQDLSVAGKRRGFAGERSSLFFEFARVADELLQPGGYVLVENVPGLFSSHGGRDFAALLGTLADLGFHDLAWRVLDSQFFGVPQRRRRVFILARRARGRRCAEILLEPESRSGNPPTRHQTREGVAGTLREGSKRGSADEAKCGTLVPSYWDGGQVSDTLDVSMLTKGQMMPEKRRFPVAITSGVRRLTPTECERLQGLPDGWTLPGSDSKRYAALGDAVTANVAEWIGRRLNLV